VIVINVDFIEDIRIEGEQRWPVGRLQERIHVENQSDLGRFCVGFLVGAITHKREDVRDVGLVI
jgi:hypothetical protein